MNTTPLSPRPGILTALAIVVLASAMGCAVGSAPAAPTGTRSTAATDAPAPASSPAAPLPVPMPATDTPDRPIVGTVLRFTSARTNVDVTVREDNPAVRDLLSRLPLDLTVEDLVGREKIAYLDPELDWDGSPGSDPEDGDLVYYTNWGNLGFYYNAEGIEYSAATLHIGTYDATREQLDELEGPVRLEVAG